MDIGCNNHNFHSSYDYCIHDTGVRGLNIDILHTRWQLCDRPGQGVRLLQSERSDRRICRFAFDMQPGSFDVRDVSYCVYVCFRDAWVRYKFRRLSKVLP